MQSGSYDTFFPLESRSRGVFGRLGTPEKGKPLLLCPTKHSVWLPNECRKDAFDFLDRYSGRANRQ